MHIDKIKHSKRQDFIYVHQNIWFEDGRINGIVGDNTNQKVHSQKQKEKKIPAVIFFKLQKSTNDATGDKNNGTTATCANRFCIRCFLTSDI